MGRLVGNGRVGLKEGASAPAAAIAVGPGGPCAKTLGGEDMSSTLCVGVGAKKGGAWLVNRTRICLDRRTRKGWRRSMGSQARRDGCC